jgi:hypothetical protein
MMHISEPQMAIDLHPEWPALLGENSKERKASIELLQLLRIHLESQKIESKGLFRIKKYFKLLKNSKLIWSDPNASNALLRG